MLKIIMLHECRGGGPDQKEAAVRSAERAMRPWSAYAGCTACKLACLLVAIMFMQALWHVPGLGQTRVWA
eukprot:958398-Pelagomonas_calceolata.AAC.4